MALGRSDLLVIAAYFAVTLTVGWWFGRGERNTHDYFLGGRGMHWLPVALSIIATEVSALTFLIVPGQSFSEDCWYLQMYAGALLGKFLIAFLLLPAFYGGSITTVYEYLGQRFGPWTRCTASVMFFASRIVASGIRLLAASLAIALVLDWPLAVVVVIAAAVAIAYTTFGGIKAIIWTDALQAIVFIGSALAIVGFLWVSTPGDWHANLAAAWDAGKFRTFRWDWNPNNDRVFWVLAIHATVATMAAMGTDQDLTQRMLTCPDVGKAQRSLIVNAIAGIPIVCLFLLIGVLLFIFHEAHPDLLNGTISKDRLVARFVAEAIPAGLAIKGLIVTGILAAAMSSLDSALGALSSTAVTDFYRPYVRPAGTERHYLAAARIFTVLFGVLLAAVALAFAGADDLLEEAFGWVSLVFGGMLGVFVLGVTTRTRGTDRVNAVLMVLSMLVLILLKFTQEHSGIVWIAWPWWVVIGAAWTFGLGACWGGHKEEPTQGVEP